MRNVSRYGVVDGKQMDFFEKADVNGPRTREVFTFLKEALPPPTDIGWNFAKFLVDHKGAPVMRIGPELDPVNLEATIGDLLAAAEASRR
mmetsp:Transcript_35151/g.69294  ORF Transcript_35151/g.69294 Transcript_35151/m.69294 type:complete len:90 (+) Transcript_35151:173-442(+)